MNKITKWILKMIAGEVVLQGNHKNRIMEYYKVLITEASKQFTENNDPTLASFLNECHEEAMKSVLKYYKY